MALIVKNWAARAHGLTTQSHWTEWAGGARVWDETAPLELEKIPKKLMRRASRVSKMAVDVALELTSEKEPDFAVFASRHGEIGQTDALMRDIRASEELSPTAFSQSVHNTAAGLYTIARQSHVPTTSIAAGERTFFMALVEAEAYLRLYPQHQVLVVMFDESLIDLYQKDLSEKSVSYSLALLLENRESEWTSADIDWHTDGDQVMPAGPRFLRWLVKQELPVALSTQDILKVRQGAQA